MARLFPRLRPFWQQFWTGMLLGTVFCIIVLAILIITATGPWRWP